MEKNEEVDTIIIELVIYKPIGYKYHTKYDIKMFLQISEYYNNKLLIIINNNR